jgi:hypothetical protein
MTQRFQCSFPEMAQSAFADFSHDRLFLRDALTRVAGNVFVNRWPEPSVWFLRNQVRNTSFITGEVEHDLPFVREMASTIQSGEWGPCISLRSELGRHGLAECGDVLHIGEPMITFDNLEKGRFETSQPSVLANGFVVSRLRVDHINQIRPRGWSDGADFVERSVGFGVLRDGEVISYAISNFPISEAIEIAVETKTEYRRRGFAIIATWELARFCFERGIGMQWTSWSGNAAACALARKVGFRDEHPHDWAFVRPKK